jgi:diaminopimelate epimerase
MRLPFTKMEGAGNDYVFVDGIRHAFPLARGPELARAWSDRHFGIGGDGLIVLTRAAVPAADTVRMLMFNADGSRGAMCGNGLRCLAKLAREHGHVTADAFVVETDAGPRPVELLRSASGEIEGARTEMGEVVIATPPRTITVAGREVTFLAGDAGNPHAVVFVDGDLDRFPVAEIGAAMQQHAVFPDGINVEFVLVEAGGLRQRTYERGSGETLACGTGAAVAASAAVQTQRVAGPGVRVRLRGGVLTIRCRGNAVTVEGPARVAFVGEVELG